MILTGEREREREKESRNLRHFRRERERQKKLRKKCEKCLPQVKNSKQPLTLLSSLVTQRIIVVNQKYTNSTAFSPSLFLFFERVAYKWRHAYFSQSVSIYKRITYKWQQEYFSQSVSFYQRVIYKWCHAYFSLPLSFYLRVA